VLTNPDYRVRARQMAADMAALPPVGDAVVWLEALAADTTNRPVADRYRAAQNATSWPSPSDSASTAARAPS
jgi:hypothetical protein